MFLRKKASRIGCTPQKVIISIEVISLNLGSKVYSAKDWDDVSKISVCFERGGKICSTGNVTVYKEDLLKKKENPAQIAINQNLELAATVYKVANGDFLEKTGK